MRADDRRVEEVEILVLDPGAAQRAEAVASRLSSRIGAGCRVGAGASAVELKALTERDQIDADALLADLEALPERERAVRVGLTSLDIAIPVFTFVFGRARQRAHAALVSLARLDPRFYGLPGDDDLLARRGADEVVHELGHAAGLAHCRDAACLMSFAGLVERVDVRGSLFCEECRRGVPAWLRGREAPR
jgi:archaemetzincin